MIRYPRHLTFELTAKCNFRCPYCYCVWHEFPALGRPELDVDGWLRVLDKCAADGVKDIFFTGGEALLRKDLFEIVDALYQGAAGRAARRLRRAGAVRRVLALHERESADRAVDRFVQGAPRVPRHVASGPPYLRGDDGDSAQV